MGSRTRRFRSTRALLAVLVGAFLVFPGPAAASRVAPVTSDAGAMLSAGTRMPTVGGRSARSAHQTMSEVARGRPKGQIDPPSVAPPRNEAATPSPVASPAPAPAMRTPSTAAIISTTTTLEATPNPLTYPEQVHLVATVTPAPQAVEGVLPVVSFYADGVFSQYSLLDLTTGVGSLDLTLWPGTHSLTAAFGGLGDYEASTSAPISEVVLQVPPLATETGNAAVQAGAGFQADADTSQIRAANQTLGVGPVDMLEMNENGSRFFDHDGNPLFHLSLRDFFLIEPAGQAPTPREPRTVYDALHGRWISTQVTQDVSSGKGHVYIEISDTSAVTGGYWVYRFDFTNEAPSTPAIGISSNKVMIGFDVYELGTETFKGSSVMVLNIADLMAHPTTIYYQRTIPDPEEHLWRPAIGLSAGNALYAVGSGTGVSGAHVLALVATGTVQTGGTGVTFVVSDLTSGPAAVPDTGMDASTPGPTSALWSNNHLWFVATRPCRMPGAIFPTDCVRVTELSTSGSFTVLQDFVIGTSQYNNFGGGIGLAGDGALVIVYSQATSASSNDAVAISTMATIQVPGDPANSVRPSQLIDQGEQRCEAAETCNTFGMGKRSYLAVPADPADIHAVWEGAASSVEGGWQTWASRLRTATGTPNGTMVLAGGRPATNSLRIGIGLAPAATATATQVLVSNSPTTSSGRLASAIQVPIGWRMPWSLADVTAGGSRATGNRVVYVQWGDGRGNWSGVKSRTIKVDTPLGSDLVPLNPARLLDTRTGNGLSGPFASHVARSFQVTGRGGVPMGAVAVTGNLTVTGQTSAGYVFLGPTAPSNPTSSTLNFPLGDTRANGVTVKLTSNGRLGAVFVGNGASKKTHLIFDVTGYLLADNPNAPIGSTWVPIEPVRALDTRVPIGLSGRFASKVPRTFCITGCVPVPDDAVAVTGNLTVTGQTTAGYVFLGPVPISNPTSSTLNFPLNDTRANNVTVQLDDNGNLTAVFVGASGAARTNLIFDVTGYFVRGPWGATFIPLNPTRILDTRAGLGLAGPFVQGTPRSFATAGRGGVPATGTLGVTGNLTITLQTSSGYAFLGPTAPATPTSSTINLPFGDTRANGVDVGLAGNGSLGAVWVGKPSSRAAMIFDVSGYFR